MLPVLLYCLLSTAPSTPFSNAQDPSQDAVDGAVHRIEASYEKKLASGKIEALSTSGAVADPAVTQVTSMALRDPNEAVRRAAIEALRFNEHPSALSALHAELGKPANLPRSPETTAALIRAVCQKGQAGSVPALSERTLDMSTRQVASAWILGMGRLRSRDSLVSVANYLQGLSESRRVALMDDFRISLMNLSGVDHGMDADAWITWWREEGASVEVPNETPKCSRLMRQEYCDYWRVSPTEAHPEQFDVGEVALAVDAPVAAKPKNAGRARRAKDETKDQAQEPDDAKTARADKETRRKNAAAKKAAAAADEGAEPAEASAKPKRNDRKNKKAAADEESPEGADSPSGSEDDAEPVEAGAKPKRADRKNKKAATDEESPEGPDSPSEAEKDVDAEEAPAKDEKPAKGKKAGGKKAADGAKPPAKKAGAKKGAAGKGGAAKDGAKKGGAKKSKSKG